MDDLVRDPVSRAHKVWEASQRAVRSFDLDAFVGLFAPGGVLEFPFAASPVPRRMEGREEICGGLEPLWRHGAASTRITDTARWFSIPPSIRTRSSSSSI